MAGDPPVEQVVTARWRPAARSVGARLAWNAGVFRAANRDDILFVQSEQTGFGYFKNFGQHAACRARARRDRRVGPRDDRRGLHAARRDLPQREEVNGESNSTQRRGRGAADAASRAASRSSPGDRIPLISAPHAQGSMPISR